MLEVSSFSLLRMTPKARPFHALCLLSAVVSISLMSAFPAARRVDLPLSVKVSSVAALGQTVPFLSTTSIVINERSWPSALMFVRSGIRRRAYGSPAVRSLLRPLLRATMGCPFSSIASAWSTPGSYLIRITALYSSFLVVACSATTFPLR